MIRLAREGLALASVAGFVWMVCQVAQLRRLSCAARRGEGRMARLGEGFVHLRTRSAYSLLEGAIKADALGELARGAGMPAVALTDRANLFGALEFSVATKDAGVQPIVGCALPVTGIGEGPPERWARIPDHRAAGPERDRLAQPDRALLRRLSWTSRPPTSRTCPGRRWREHAEGLILLSGGPDGPVDPLFAAGRTADGAARRWPRCSGCSATASTSSCSATAWPREATAEPGLVACAYEHDVPLVATNDVYFAAAKTYRAHDALLCIADGAFLGQDERRRVTAEHWFKGADEMRRLFADLPEACDNTLEIARRCAFMVKKRDPVLPRFPTVGGRSEDEELAAQAREGLKARLADAPRSYAPEADYWARLEREIGVIQSMGFSGYFLIVSDFMKWAVSHGIPVGPGRGSGAGSLVAWSLLITGLDPLRFKPAVRALPRTRRGSRCPTSTSTSARSGARR